MGPVMAPIKRHINTSTFSSLEIVQQGTACLPGTYAVLGAVKQSMCILNVNRQCQTALKVATYIPQCHAPHIIADTHLL